MKISNKILIGFFGFIFIYMTAAFTEIRLRGDLYHMDDSNAIIETVDIIGVKYLILPDLDQRIFVRGSDKPRIEVRSISGDLLQNLKYNITGDTLTLITLDLAEDQHINLSIYMPKDTFKSMHVNGAAVIVKELDQKILTVFQSDGSITFNDNNILGKLNIEAINDARFNSSGSKLDTLSVLIDNSEVTIRGSIKRVEGSMSNDSYLHVRDVDDIEFKKDESSRLRLD